MPDVSFLLTLKLSLIFPVYDGIINSLFENCSFLSVSVFNCLSLLYGNNWFLFVDIVKFTFVDQCGGLQSQSTKAWRAYRTLIHFSKFWSLEI